MITPVEIQLDARTVAITGDAKKSRVLLPGLPADYTALDLQVIALEHPEWHGFTRIFTAEWPKAFPPPKAEPEQPAATDPEEGSPDEAEPGSDEPLAADAELEDG